MLKLKAVIVDLVFSNSIPIELRFPNLYFDESLVFLRTLKFMDKNSKQQL